MGQSKYQTYESSTGNPKAILLLDAYAAIGDHVVSCDSCLKGKLCAEFERLFKAAIKVR
jgi:hypothetical protein